MNTEGNECKLHTTKTRPKRRDEEQRQQKQNDNLEKTKTSVQLELLRSLVIVAGSPQVLQLACRYDEAADSVQSNVS